MKLNYTKVGDYFLPNLTIKEQKGTINKYCYLRLNYLKENKKDFIRLFLYKINKQIIFFQLVKKQKLE